MGPLYEGFTYLTEAPESRTLGRHRWGSGLIGNRKIAVTLGGLLAATLLLVSACREEEQDRVLRHKEGVYLGTPEPAISDDKLQDLRHRAARQRY